MSRMPSRLFALVLLPITMTAVAEPLGVRNEAALARAFALPGLGYTSLASADLGWRLSVDLASEFVDKQRGGESLLLDGETHRYAVRLAQGWGDSLDWTLDIPVVHVGGGFMDGLIENWHDTFGLPQGGRDQAPRDRYRYRYTRDGQTVLDTPRTGTSLGDVQVGVGYGLDPGLVVRAQLKLPTGDEDRLSGGNFGAAAWLDWALPFEPGSAWGGFFSGGLSGNERGKVLRDQQQTWIPFAGVGLDLRVLPNFTALTQLYVHAPLYDDSDVAALEQPGVQFALGGRWCPGAGPQCVELSFQEDLAVGVSPDFTLRLALQVR